jgi:hypothetical protein
MTDDEEKIRTLIENWAEAVHSGDLSGVLADHSDDIVMFDVPPPYEGVRGIDAYRETRPQFFDWQARGASFEIVSLDELGAASSGLWPLSPYWSASPRHKPTVGTVPSAHCWPLPPEGGVGADLHL